MITLAEKIWICHLCGVKFQGDEEPKVILKHVKECMGDPTRNKRIFVVEEEDAVVQK